MKRNQNVLSGQIYTISQIVQQIFFDNTGAGKQFDKN